MAMTALSVAISCSRSASSPGSLVTMPEVMIITEGFNPTVQRYTDLVREKRESRRQTKKERAASLSMKKRRCWGGENGMRGWRAKDDDIDCVLDPAFAYSAIPRLCLNPSRGWDKMAAGRTSRPRSGLCVVINGNLKQRELTISFFISSPVPRAQERPRRTRSPRPNAHRRVVQTHEYTRVHTTGVPFAPRRVDLPEGGKRERKAFCEIWENRVLTSSCGIVGEGVAMVEALLSGYTQAKKLWTSQSAKQPT